MVKVQSLGTVAAKVADQPVRPTKKILKKGVFAPGPDWTLANFTLEIE